MSYVASPTASESLKSTLFNGASAVSRDRVYAAKDSNSIALALGKFQSSQVDIDHLTEMALTAIANSNLTYNQKQDYVAAAATLFQDGGDPGQVRDMLTMLKLDGSSTQGPVEAMTVDNAKAAFRSNVQAMRQQQSYSLSSPSDQITLTNQSLVAPEATFGPNPMQLLSRAFAMMGQQNPFAPTTGKVVNVVA